MYRFSSIFNSSSILSCVSILASLQIHFVSCCFCLHFSRQIKRDGKSFFLPCHQPNYIQPTISSSLKVGLSPSKKVFIICCNERPLKMMKNAFYFMLKALFVLAIRLTRKLRLISKFMTSHVLDNKELRIVNISINKGNQTMKLGQSI